MIVLKNNGTREGFSLTQDGVEIKGVSHMKILPMDASNYLEPRVQLTVEVEIEEVALKETDVRMFRDIRSGISLVRLEDYDHLRSEMNSLKKEVVRLQEELDREPQQ